MSDHKTFCAFGAYAVDVSDPAAIVVMVLAVDYDLRSGIARDKLVTLDFTKVLGMASWDDVILDGMGLHTNGKPKTVVPQLRREDPEGIQVLSVGPTFPGPHLGGIYVERSKFYAEVRPKLDPKHDRWPGYPETYQVMSTAARINGSIQRYHGFSADVVKSSGSRKELRIWRPFSSATVAPSETVTVDLDDRAQCDDPARMASEIQDPDRPDLKRVALSATSAPGDRGAIFLALETCAALDLRGPKEPPGG